MPFLSSGASAYLSGTYSADGHHFELRAEETSAGTTVLFTNFTSGKSKLLTREGAFIFSGKHLLTCNAVSNFQLFADLSVQTIADEVDFQTVEIHNGQAPADFIAVAATRSQCVALTNAQANMSTPEALERFPVLANEFQTKDVQAAKHNMYKTENRRKLSEKLAKAEKISDAVAGVKELVDLMTHANSGNPMTMEEINHSDGKRRLAAASARKLRGAASDTIKAMTGRQTRITNFELWVATRMADPTFISTINLMAAGDQDWAAVSQVLGATLQLDLSGQYGVTSMFAAWSGFNYANFGGNLGPMAGFANPLGSDSDFDALQFDSMMVYADAFPGSCAGGFTKQTKKVVGKQEFCAEVNSEAAMMICHKGGGILKPLAWASFLEKDGEVVLAFQGTQITKYEMFAYTILAAPVFFEYKNYYAGFKTGAVVTEGLAMYVFQLLNCVDSIFWAIPGKLGYITGHSLGGSAATLYSQLQLPSGIIGTETHLATFGAPATFNRGCLAGECPTLKYAWGSRDSNMKYDQNHINQLIQSTGVLQMEEQSKCGGYAKGVAEGQLAYIPGSVRYMHKFDPVSSLGFGLTQWAHGTEFGMLLFDMPGCRGAQWPACSRDMASSSHPMVQRGMMEEYLCESDVRASGIMFQCAPEYYSYTNMMNPFPCVEVIFAQAFLYDQQHDAWFSYFSPFIPFEDLEECATSYTATVDAYFAAYLASDIASVPGIETDFQDITGAEDAMIMMGYYAAWGLMYVHMTYPNYALCVDANFGEYGYGDYQHMNAPVKAGDNGFEEMADTVLAEIPSMEEAYDEVVSWFDGAGAKKAGGKKGGKVEEARPVAKEEAKKITTPDFMPISFVPQGRGK
jgi:hypothetical protein